MIAIDAGVAAFTVTGAVCEIGMTPDPPSPVAEMALASALVELNVVVNTPLALLEPDDFLSASIGFKFQTPRGILLVTNALFPLRNSGMQPSVVWTGGLEYNF